MKCGSAEGLQFDHIDPSTKFFSIAKDWGIAWVKILAELKKCQLLCDPCHRVKTASEQGIKHGEGLSGKRNCPCGPCKSRKREYSKQYMRHYRERSGKGIQMVEERA